MLWCSSKNKRICAIYTHCCAHSRLLSECFLAGEFLVHLESLYVFISASKARALFGKTRKQVIQLKGLVETRWACRHIYCCSSSNIWNHPGYFEHNRFIMIDLFKPREFYMTFNVFQFLMSSDIWVPIWYNHAHSCIQPISKRFIAVLIEHIVALPEN